MKLWAPEIHKLGGQYVLYYTASDQSGLLSILTLTLAVALTLTLTLIYPYP